MKISKSQTTLVVSRMEESGQIKGRSDMEGQATAGPMGSPTAMQSIQVRLMRRGLGEGQLAGKHVTWQEGQGGSSDRRRRLEWREDRARRVCEGKRNDGSRAAL